MTDDVLPYAPVVLKLLQDTVYHDDKDWELLLSYLPALRRHFSAIGLALHVDEVEGYAYLTQPDPDEEEGGETAVSLPRLVRRIPLSYDATLLCVLLRESLQQFDAQHPDLTRCVLTRAEIQEMMQLFYAEQSDVTRWARRVDRAIRQVERVGYLKQLRGQKEDAYEVRRIIKAKISADTLVAIRDRLQAHAGELED